jgi:hypothetical protein
MLFDLLRTANVSYPTGFQRFAVFVSEGAFAPTTAQRRALFPVSTGQPLTRIRKDFVDRAPGEALGDTLSGRNAEASYSGNSGGDDSGLAGRRLFSKWFLHASDDTRPVGQIIMDANALGPGFLEQRLHGGRLAKSDLDRENAP